MVSPARYRHLLLLLPGWIAFMAYLPALKNGFVWDDTYFITDLPYLRDPALWWQHIRAPLFVSQNYFRPLPLLTFVLEARVEPLNAAVFHLGNLVLHACNTTLVVLLARALTTNAAGSRQQDDRASWRSCDGKSIAGLVAGLVAGLLFGLHPVLIESVSWISDRFDLMMAFFLLLALLCDTRLKRARPRAALIWLLFFLALLCKETAIVFVALLPLWQLTCRFGNATDSGISWRESIKETARESWPTWAVLPIATVAYLTLRHQALGGFYQSDTLIVSGTLLQHVLLTAKTLGWYLLLLCWPFGQISPVHPASTPIPLDDGSAWLGLAAIVIVLGGTLAALRRKPRAGLLIVAALVALAPVANLVPLTIGDNIVHDRYLLLPLVFASLLVATLPVARFRTAAGVGLGLWTAVSLTTIVIAVPFWASNLSLWGWAAAQAPRSNIARGNLVSALLDSGHPAEALTLSQEIVAATPDNAIAIYDMALALMRLGRNEESRKYCELALRHFGAGDNKGRMDVAEAWNLLGFLSMRAGDMDGAEKSLREAARLMPYLTRPHFNLAMVNYQRGRIAEGDEEIAFALRYDSPTLAFSHRLHACRKRAEALAKNPLLTTGVQSSSQDQHQRKGRDDRADMQPASVCE